MIIDKTRQDITFKSSFLVSILIRCFGLMLISLSLDLLKGWLHPSWDRLPYMLLVLPVGLFLWVVAGTLLLYAAQVQILDGQLRFRRILAWEAVPLSSITNARPWGPVIYLRASYGGKRLRLFFNPEDFKVRLHDLPIIEYLQEVCKRNVANSGAAGSDLRP